MYELTICEFMLLWYAQINAQFFSLQDSFSLSELVSDANQSFSVPLLGCHWFPNDLEYAERQGIPEQSAQKHQHRSVCNYSSSLWGLPFSVLIILRRLILNWFCVSCL